MALQCGLSLLALTAVVLLSLWTPTSGHNFRAPKRCTCKAQGDPHITMCNGTYVTCSSPGSQVYLNTSYILITGVNTFVSAWATVLKEVTMEFRSLTMPSLVTARYEASNGNIPTTFAYQAPVIAPYDRVVLQTTPYKATLKWPFIGMIIELRSEGTFYGLTVRAACNILRGVGILIHGCPPNATIDIDDVRRLGHELRLKAEEACLDNGVPAQGVMMNMCMYDVTVTNDPQIAVATAHAIEDSAGVVERDDEMVHGAGSPCLLKKNRR